MITQVSRIRFGIMGDRDVERLSTCLIDNPSLAAERGTVYDQRLGCVQNNSTCPTCSNDVWKCPGHFGHIDLNTPIILFYKQCLPFLKCICFNCHRLLCTKEELTMLNIRTYDKTIDYVSKCTSCSRCNAPHPDIKYNPSDCTLTAHHKYKNKKAVRELTPAIIKSVFDNVPDEDVSLIGIDVSMFHPRNLVLTKFPVIPTCCRPRMITPSNSNDDDLSLLIIDVLKNNLALGKLISTGVSDSADKTYADNYERLVNAIKTKLLAYCDNTKGKATHNTNHKPMTGLKDRMIKKTGQFRQALMGKRCDWTARTVVGPDPTLSMNQVGIPIEIARSLIVTEYVTDRNVDELTRMVNGGLVSAIIKVNGSKIDVVHAIVRQGTRLVHGDVVVSAEGRKRVVTNCKEELREDDVLIRDGKRIPVKQPERRHLKLDVGDRVQRYLRDGDPVLVNRQPTLHRNSMQGMLVKILPGKTTRVNMSITPGFNMDFDGDEGNIFTVLTLEALSELLHVSNAKNNILSGQTNRSEMVIVQDSLLAAYLMTRSVVRMKRSDFFNCMMRTSAFDRYPSWQSRIDSVSRLRSEDGYPYTCHALFAFILPSDFHVDANDTVIREGVILSGHLDKHSLKGGKSSIIRLLCMEYGPDVAATFIDDIQFLTNAWLEINVFSIGIADCMIGSEIESDKIRDSTYRYFLEAEQVNKTTEDRSLREMRTNLALNKAKDVGLSIAKNALKPDNNFISTVSSGSKGDYFNIAQITGLCGQQNISGKRPALTIENRSRSTIHYPRVVTDVKLKYESRGFISSSFMRGMNPREMFFHAMAGRVGMISTAMDTSTSGYLQRSCIKSNEDLKVAYDGSVRDVSNNIYQMSYGYQGFDPCKVTYDANGLGHPIDMRRLADRLNTGLDIARYERLTEATVEEVICRCRWKRQIPDEAYDDMWNRHERNLRNELVSVELHPTRLRDFVDTVCEKYHTARATPGDSVGILSAQSIGERQTQSSLNMFHTTGKLSESGVNRFEELLNMTKTLKCKSCVIYFKKRFDSADELRSSIFHSRRNSLLQIRLIDIIARKPIKKDATSFEYQFNMTTLYVNMISPSDVKEILSKEYFSICDIDVGSSSITIKYKHSESRPRSATHSIGGGDDEEDNDDTTTIVQQQQQDCGGNNAYDELDALRYEVENATLKGIRGIQKVYIDHDGTEWRVLTEGSNLKLLLAHPEIDGKRLYCNDIWEVFECLGITAVRKMMYVDMKRIAPDVNDCHVRLLIDKMTAKGKPMSLTRYSMRVNDDVGPLSKATFEESLDIMIKAAVRTEVENIKGVSAAIISGNQVQVGTGYFDVMFDMNRFDKDS